MRKYEKKVDNPDVMIINALDERRFIKDIFFKFETVSSCQMKVKCTFPH